MSFRWKHHATRCKQLDLTRSFSQLLSRSLAHLIYSIGNHRHDRERADMTTRVDELVGSPKICTSAGLGQRLSRVEESWSDYCAFCQEPSNRVICTTSLSNCGESVHQAVTQVARTSQDNLSLRISNVFGAQSKSCNMSMRVNQTWHECLTGDVDNRSVCMVDRLRGYRVNVFIFHKNIKGSLQARETIEHEVGILKENTRHPL